MTIATVTTKGQVTIPAEIRQSFDIGPGDQLVFYRALEGDLRVHVRKLRHGSGAASLSAEGRKVSVEEMSENVRRVAGQRHRRIGAEK